MGGLEKFFGEQAIYEMAKVGIKVNVLQLKKYLRIA